MTDAHFQTAVLNQRLKLWYPEHEPRTTDPHYKLFNAAKRALKANNVPCWRCGVTYANLNPALGMPATDLNPLAAHQLEAHHSEIEFSLANAVDVELWWAKEYDSIEAFVAKHPEFRFALDASDDPDFAGYAPNAADLAQHKDLFDAYVESDSNLTQLCLPTDELVLMADGARERIGSLSVGDRVAGPDRDPHTITDTLARWYDNHLVVIDGHRMTPNHPVLTPAGWLPAGRVRAGQVLGHLVDVAVAEVLGLRAIEPEVLDAVVRPIAVDVMDPFGGFETTPEVLLHDPAVFGYADISSIAPYRAAHIARGMQTGMMEDAFVPFPGLGVERGQSARIGAELLDRAVLVHERDSTGAAHRGRRMLSFIGTSARRGACATAGGVGVREPRADQEGTAADPALAKHARSRLDARWRAVRKVEAVPYRGFVHDITVSSYPAFVTGSLIVHNCDVCHRSREQGIHWIPEPDWRAMAYWRKGLPQHVQAAS